MRTETQPPLYRRWYFLLPLAAALGVVGLYLNRQARLKQPKVAVETAFGCIDRRDADCLMDLVGDYERSSAPTKSQMREFMRKVFEPRLRGFAPSGPIEYESGLDPIAESFGGRKYTHVDGRVVHIGASGRATEGKAVCWPHFAFLVLAVCQTYAVPGEVPGSTAVVRRALAELKPQMEAIGIKGAFLNTNTAERFYTWDEWIGRVASR